ncbi:MAG: S-methyl-5-thioribose-1-phosphate isomerase [Planctomycetia bacterium]|nr:S-methyl-5-thioribose-1-phosphate isomerase [Planctomycetia bacterium]
MLYRSLAWQGDALGELRLLDQTRLPGETIYRHCTTIEQVWQAIRELCVRGAPAIGVSAAYGVVLGVRAFVHPTLETVKQATNYLRTSRPTAVNLFWALDRMDAAAEKYFHKPEGQLIELLLATAQDIEDEDVETSRSIGEFGSHLIPDGGGVLTHCNTGALATAEYGTALAAIIMAWEQGKRFTVFADETRPLLQGARLTAWELQQHGIPCTLICDNMAAQVMREGKVQLAIVGADRIAANGDTANKIGTYGVAILCNYHKLPFFVAAPQSTFDLNLADGTGIPIEQRHADEITQAFGKRTAPVDVAIYNPAFDVTPASLISGIVTEHGIIQPVNAEEIARRLR